MPGHHLYLAAGLQSGGTSLVSWCFLQRADMDGILDLAHDTLTPIPEIRARHAWAKATIASFTFDEIADYYRWQGWDVHPLLIVRDPRDAYASLQYKWYGQNGTTAEDPPLRIRLARFHATWRAFVERGWPVMSYERLVLDPEAELRAACAGLGLDWDPAMLTWPKPPGEIAVGVGGNQTLVESRGEHGISGALIRIPKRTEWQEIPPSEMRWLRERFADLVEAFAYPPFSEATAGPHGPPVVPNYGVTRRHAMEEEIRKLDGCRAGLMRLRGHPVIGRLIGVWAKLVNPGLNEVFDDVGRGDT
jgi:hypothetical protein